jgi:ferredoxin
MEVDDGLEPEDKLSGYILACQAIPKSDVEVEA